MLYYLNRYKNGCIVSFTLILYFICVIHIKIYIYRGVCYRHVMDYMPQEFKGVNLLRNERR